MKPRRALVISPRLPEFDRESGLLRVLHLIEMLQRRGWEVTFGCLRMPTDPERYARVLEQRGVEVHAPLRKLERSATWRDSISRSSPSGTSRSAFCPSCVKKRPRRGWWSTRSTSISCATRGTSSGVQDASGPGQLDTNQAGEMVRELNAYAAADAVLTVSQKEADLINDLIGRDDFALTLPDTEELARSPVPLSKRRGILFLGNFLHAPNLDAASYLCEEIVPRLDPALLSEHEVSIVGTDAGEQVRDLAAGLPHMKIVGWVPSVIPYLNSARASVVPLRYGAGTKRKIVQALMVGTPTVTTSVGRRRPRRSRSTRGADRRRSVRVRGRQSNACCNARSPGAGWPAEAAGTFCGCTDAPRSRRASTRCSRRCWRAGRVRRPSSRWRTTAPWTTAS